MRLLVSCLVVFGVCFFTMTVFAQNKYASKISFVNVNFNAVQFSILSKEIGIVYVGAPSKYSTSDAQLLDQALSKTLEYVERGLIEDLETKQQSSCSVSAGFFQSPLVQFELELITTEKFENLISKFKSIGICHQFSYF